MSRKAFLTIISVAIVSFLGTVDMSIVNTALPQISKELAIPMNQAEWISSAYLILICMTLILFGKLGDQTSKATIFQAGTLLFTISSLACGFSTSLIGLLIARGIQGIGAAMTMATNLGLITESVSVEARGRGLGINTSIGQLGYIAGPAVAGFILSITSWHWIFWFNVPIGIIAMIFGHFIYPRNSIADFKAIHIDWLGLTTLAGAILAFFLSIFSGQAIGFDHPSVIIGLIITGVLIIGTIHIERRVKDPILDLRLFANPGFTVSIIALMIMYIIIYFNNVLLPFYIQDTLGFTPAKMGLIMSILPVVNVFTAYLGGVLGDRYGAVKMSTKAALIFVVATSMFAIMSPTWPLVFMLEGFVVFAIANGLFQNNPMVMNHAPANQQGIAGSILALSRNIGFAVGLSLSTSTLYAAMSIRAGHRITTYPFGHDQWFIFGMHATYWVASALMMAVFGLLWWLQRLERN